VFVEVAPVPCGAGFASEAVTRFKEINRKAAFSKA